VKRGTLMVETAMLIQVFVNKLHIYFGFAVSLGKKLISLDNPQMIVATPIEISNVMPYRYITFIRISICK
jgi:hypothetical protein